ncbi:MAG: hypothetical protein EAX87_01335 [Candidatus Thorarchaeota archaeon]|nr:hypothetical protein [Candidatus Thorarchaeota archaeon]
MGEDVSLNIPSGVEADAVMDFLKRGHGYTWTTVSKEPVLMVLGHPSKHEHPELVIMNDSLVVNSSDQKMLIRIKMMLKVLARQGGRT